MPAALPSIRRGLSELLEALDGDVKPQIDVKPDVDGDVKPRIDVKPALDGDVKPQVDIKPDLRTQSVERDSAVSSGFAALVVQF